MNTTHHSKITTAAIIASLMILPGLTQAGGSLKNTAQRAVHQTHQTSQHTNNFQRVRNDHHGERHTQRRHSGNHGYSNRHGRHAGKHSNRRYYSKHDYRGRHHSKHHYRGRHHSKHHYRGHQHYYGHNSHHYKKHHYYGSHHDHYYGSSSHISGVYIAPGFGIQFSLHD